MTDHVNLVMPKTGDARANLERELNLNAGEVQKEWRESGAVDTRVNTMRLKATNGNPNPDLCDRLAAAAKERGRPLTPKEIELVGRGEELPPVATSDRAKTAQEVIAVLEARVRPLEETK
jgi:hypothetical protein